MAKWPYVGPWRRIRLQILERDDYRCQIVAANCTTAANHVDHIVPVEQGGAPYDPANLRAACQRCNVGRRNSLHDRDGWRNVATRITLVYGPPGAGKSTYVQQHRGPRDLIVDYDLIGHALGSEDRHSHQEIHGAINAARNAVLSKIRRGETGAGKVWIISTNPDAVRMFPHHDAVLLRPDAEISRQRAQDGGRTESALELHEQWHQASAGPSRDW